MRIGRANIWTKLLLAFVFISSLTLLVGLMAMLIFTNSESLIEEISEEHLPEIIQVGEFARIGGEIVAVAPNIMSANDDGVRTEVKKDLDELLGRISDQLNALTIPQSDYRQRVETMVGRIEENLVELLASVALRGEQQKKMDRSTERLRWLYVDLLDELDPLSQDYGYNVDAEVERLVENAKQGNTSLTVGTLRESMEVKEIIEKIRSNSVFLLTLMMQASTLESAERLDNSETLAADAIAILSQNSNELPNDVSSFTLKQILNDIYELSLGEQSIFELRRQIVALEKQGRDILTMNRMYIAELDLVIDDIVLKAENRVSRMAEDTRMALQRAGAVLVLIVLLSFVTVAAVMWFYVRGGIVARLAAISRSMLAISKGDLSHQIHESGEDEIGKMAAALRVFRDTAVEVEEANFQAIIENAGVGLILVNPDGSIHSFNPRAEELFGTSAQEVVGSSILETVRENDRERLENTCTQVLGGRREQQVVEMYSGQRKDGSLFPVDIFMTMVPQHHTNRLMITVHDVTERELAQELLRERVREKTEHLSMINEKLREEVKERKRVQSELVQAGKLAALGQLSAGIAHELNQPLSAIRYYLHNASKLLEMGETAIHRENLAKIDELVERIALMINHLKTFARRQPDRLGEIDVNGTIDKALELVGGKIERHTVTVEMDCSGSACTAFGDEVGLQQVLVNIFSNAIDAVGKNDPDNRHISVSVEDNIDQVLIDVSDNGPGLETKEPENVFDPFYTTKEVGQGLGLGLSISYNIIKNFGGSIKASNRNSGGARFTVVLKKNNSGNDNETDW